MSGGRKAFTPEEDGYLVKYIATYNPTVSGRSGNALYQRLCENADRKWPWSTRHPWQSWRDRYYKNSDMFDRRIKKYIKKYNLPEEKKKYDVAAFLRKRAREIEGAAHGKNEDGDDSDSRARKRKRVPNDDDGGRVKVKEEPMNGTKVALQGRSSEQRQGHPPKPSTAHMEQEHKTVVKEEPELVKPEVEAEGKESDMSDESEGEEKDENDEAENEDEAGQKSEPVGSDDYAQDIFQSVPPIVTEDVSDTETDSDEEDSEPQEDELDPTQPTLVMKTSQQNDGPSLYPDISTLPSPHLREQEKTQLDSNRHSSAKASSPPIPRPRPRSSPQPVASTSKVQLSPSHRLPRSSSLLRDTPPKRKVPKDVDFFESVPPTPTPSSLSPPPIIKRKPPRLIEGAFRNAFANTPQACRESDDSSDDKEQPTAWPPVRREKVTPSSQVLNKKYSESEVRDSSGTGSQITSNGSHKAKSREFAGQIAPGDTQASLSRRVSLPLGPSKAEPHPFAQPQRNGTLADQELSKAAVAQRSASKEHTPTDRAWRTRGESPATTPGHQAANRKPQRASSSSTVLTRKSEVLRHQMADTRIPALQTSSRVYTLAGPSQKRSSSLRHEAKLVDHALPTDSNTPGNPFKANPATAGESKEKGKARAPSLFDRRNTIDFTSERTTSTVHLDLRSGSFHQPRQSLPPQTHIPTATSTPDSSQPTLLPIPIAAEDRFKVEYLGMSAAVSMISKRFSVAEEVVWRGWEKTKSISKTEEYCRRLAELNAKSEAMVLKEMRKSGIISEETPARASRSTAGSPRSRRSSGQRRLKIKPLVDDDDVMSEYTPPFSTRAAQYARLAKQGRKDEALTREWRRASFGGGSFPYRQCDPELSSPPRKPDVGPAEDVPGPAETPPPGTPLLTTPGENAEDARRDELEGLDEEAFLTATAQNAEALREIERRVDPDLMLQWAAGLLAQLRDRATQLPQNSAG